MIHRIAASNFYCIRDRLDIDLSVTAQAPEASERFTKINPGDSVRTPKVVGLFGPNASGKSTILRLLSFVEWFLQHGFSLPPKDLIPCFRFSSKASLSKPIYLEIEFDASTELMEKADPTKRCRYIYSLTLDGGADQPAHIAHEHLSYFPPDASRRVRIFERGPDDISMQDGVRSGTKSFRLEGYTRSIPKVLRPNVSLISTLAQLGHEPSIVLRDLAGKIETNIFFELYRPDSGFSAHTYINNSRLFDDLNREISKLDLGITKVQIEKSPNERSLPEPKFIHRGLLRPVKIEGESEGTRQFFNIFPMISQALHYGGVAVVDEFDSSIHPLVLPEIMNWFYDRKRNPRNAQLWFTGQNPYMLQQLDKEQILFCQKDDDGAASAFRLSDMRAVRRNDNYMKKYISGFYGAVPHFG